jgi:hypothetical protein
LTAYASEVWVCNRADVLYRAERQDDGTWMERTPAGESIAPRPAVAVLEQERSRLPTDDELRLFLRLAKRVRKGLELARREEPGKEEAWAALERKLDEALLAGRDWTGVAADPVVNGITSSSSPEPECPRSPGRRSARLPVGASPASCEPDTDRPGGR